MRKILAEIRILEQKMGMHLNIGKTPPKLFKPEKAEQVAEKLKKSDPDWDYRVVHDPKGKGYSFIEIYDESGELVGHFSD